MGKALLEGSAFLMGWFWEMAAGAENRFGDFLPSRDLRKVFFCTLGPSEKTCFAFSGSPERPGDEN